MVAFSCWICGSRSGGLVRSGVASDVLNPACLMITDSSYGRTLDLYRCKTCGFVQAHVDQNVVSLYEDLEDPEYVAGWTERSLQHRRILELVHSHIPTGRLLDIGAGGGMLVEQALQMGYDAEGIEPSRWLTGVARARSLPVHQGAFPSANVVGEFDVITIVDVLEHVQDPVGLLRAVESSLTRTGLGVVVVPDVGSIVARLLGRKWWHFRTAHIGYFDKETILTALHRAGLAHVLIRRPAWYFPLGYLLERLNRYLPGILRLRNPSRFSRPTVKLNLRDSLLVMFKPALSITE